MILLGKHESEHVGLIAITYDNFSTCVAVSSKDGAFCQQHLYGYADVLVQKVDTLISGQVKLQGDDIVTPVTQTTGCTVGLSRPHART